MSKWLALAQQQIDSATRVPFAPIEPIATESSLPGAVPIVPFVPIAPETRPIGTNGAIGTKPEDDTSERQAIAEIEGGVTLVFSLAFAAFQIGCSAGCSVDLWQRAIDDAGRFLDQHGHAAAALGWMAADLFAADGLAWALKGAAVVNLTATAATLLDGRVFRRSDEGS
ncbi:hypothetical protein [Microvirga zambiensis]|uniref:hypothetical protein n=1 Tax=Microvirga zambiensis TaxID=1402137 RepID=UPI00191E2C86|nr:hypothetical protein [Microvirga zambiensis]